MKTLKISISPLDCSDNTRLTDEGLIDFSEDSVCRHSLETLDLSEAMFCKITSKSILKLKHLSKLQTLMIRVEHFDYLAHAKTFNEDCINKNIVTVKLATGYLHNKKFLIEPVSQIFCNADIKLIHD